ncbi:hypothetical protein HQ865_01470 [Mucilaginibacter mali]|uniref:Uncharacterized protein n=1 Tax=Mucilaginibacter mali TaxID=2740462 RepID=A0A7D4UJ34_9SPHI|nr:hypothetical protein [Mucilaginibacter mali]QKJ28482.1 hypothetical protein HQ865_01470 [Mucilaginibacter mali]
MPQQNQSTANIQDQVDKLKRSMTDLNNTLLILAQSQGVLGKTLKDSVKYLKTLDDAADDATSSIKKLNAQLSDNSKTIGKSTSALEENKKALADLPKLYDTLSKSQQANSVVADALDDNIKTLTANVKDQEKALEESKKTFDYHKAVMEQITSATEKLKKSNKDFGPVMEDVTKGFNIMKNGLAVVKTGFTGVGAAIKATGFGLLVLVLQSVVEYFTTTTEGAKKLKGGIAAISLVIDHIKKYVSGILSTIGENIVNAFSKPGETIKKVWNAILENLHSRLKGFSILFKAILSGDLKGMNDGLIQISTGVTHGTDKIKQSFDQLKTNITKAGKVIVETYNKAAESSDKATKKITDNNGKITEGTHGKGKPKTPKREILPKLEEAHSTGLYGSSGSDIPIELVASTNDSQKKTTTLQAEDIQPKESVEDNIIKSHNADDWKTEFALKQQQLDNEKAQAEKSAREKNQSVLKVDEEYKEKQKQLDKAKLEAQFANQQNYLKSVDKLSGALTGIFGKNTIAARAAFKAHQAAAAGQVIIDTEKSIMGIWSANASIPFVGVPKAIAETAIAVAAGASSLAGIVKQKPGFAKGGHYTSDGRGALLSGYSHTDDTNAYLRSGEAVVVSEAMRNPWARNLVSAINVAHGGRDFSVANPGRGYAIGGIYTDGGNANRYYNQPVNDVKDLANTVAYQMINNFPPIYVDVKDVNNQQNILAQTVNRVNL